MGERRYEGSIFIQEPLTRNISTKYNKGLENILTGINLKNILETSGGILKDDWVLVDITGFS